MLYEDDAMVVASALTGLSLAEGDRFRRRVQKLRTDEERRAVSAEFIAAAVAHGTPREVAESFWIQMAKFNSPSAAPTPRPTASSPGPPPGSPPITPPRTGSAPSTTTRASTTPASTSSRPSARASASSSPA
jgi:hypothetical protein